MFLLQEKNISRMVRGMAINLKPLTPLKERIDCSGLKRGDISSRLGVARTTLWRWETGDDAHMTVRQAIGLAGILGCSTEDVRPDLKGK